MTLDRPLSLRQEQQAATRQRLLDAAADAFAESGFTGTTVDRIVSAAGTSRATFYLHFQNKTDALLATWTERELPEVEQLFHSFDEGGDFSFPAARTWVSKVVTYWEKHGRIARTAVQALALEPELNQLWVAGMVRATDAMPTYRGRVAEGRALLNVIQMERVLYFWTNGGLPTSREALVDTLARAWALEQ